jgi:hypothetical protein
VSPSNKPSFPDEKSARKGAASAEGAVSREAWCICDVGVGVDSVPCRDTASRVWCVSP